MKKFQNIRSILLYVLITGSLTLMLSLPVAAQDSAKTRAKKGTVVLKIKKNDNGNITVIDTTFNITTPAGHKEFEEYLKKHEEELENLGEELENIEVFVDMPDFPDSMGADSVIKYLRFSGNDKRSPHLSWQDREGGFDYSYDFDIPCHPDFSSPPFHGYEGFDEEFLPGQDLKVFRHERTRQTLSDLIGDIPMDRVKSYSIKDRKNGKRIIIDIEDAPFLENQDRVIIMRSDERPSHKRTHSDRQMKVVIKTDDSGKVEKISGTPPPPPPPPPVK